MFFLTEAFLQKPFFLSSLDFLKRHFLGCTSLQEAVDQGGAFYRVSFRLNHVLNGRACVKPARLLAQKDPSTGGIGRGTPSEGGWERERSGRGTPSEGGERNRGALFAPTTSFGRYMWLNATRFVTRTNLGSALPLKTCMHSSCVYRKDARRLDRLSASILAGYV